jgi:hypothetical protein
VAVDAVESERCICAGEVRLGAKQPQMWSERAEQGYSRRGHGL